MSSSFRDRPSLSERLRGKSTEEIIQEMRNSMDESKKNFFNKSRPSWFSSSASSSRRFPFEDDRKDLDYHLDKLVEEHPEIAEPLKNWRGDKGSKKKRTDSSPSSSTHKSPSSETCSTSSDCGIDKKSRESSKTPQDKSKPDSTDSVTGRENKGLDSTKLRYTVPDMRREMEEEQDRVGRSQSAPPSQQNNDNQPPSGQQHGGQPQAQAREPVVRHIPIFVEGRDEPVIPKDFVDSPFPAREKRNLSRETSPIPPARRTLHDPEPVHKEFVPQTQPRHTSSVHINQSGPPHQHGPDRQIPVEIKVNQEPARQQPHQQTAPGAAHTGPQHPGSQQPGPGQVPPQPQQPPQPKLPLGPLEKVQAVQDEVGNLMEKVEKYNGGNRQDKEYIYLDEMLTRNLLKLDDIETEGKEDVRAARKQAIRQIQRCISQLESKAPTGEKTNTDDTQPIESNQASTEQAENSQPSGQTTESKGSS